MSFSTISLIVFFLLYAVGVLFTPIPAVVLGITALVVAVALMVGR